MIRSIAINIDTVNDAFRASHDEPTDSDQVYAAREEIGRILRGLAYDIETQLEGTTLCDENGNSVGKVIIKFE